MQYFFWKEWCVKSKPEKFGLIWFIGCKYNCSLNVYALLKVVNAEKLSGVKVLFFLRQPKLYACSCFAMRWFLMAYVWQLRHCQFFCRFAAVLTRKWSVGNFQDHSFCWIYPAFFSVNCLPRIQPPMAKSFKVNVKYNKSYFSGCGF